MDQPQLHEPSETNAASHGGSPPQLTEASTFFDTVMDNPGDDDDSQHKTVDAEHGPEGGAPILSRDVETGSEQTGLPTTGSTANVPISGVAAGSDAITLEWRLRQHQPLLTNSYDHLPGGLDDYERAVYTGFPNFEFRSLSPLLEQAYNAFRTGDPGAGEEVITNDHHEVTRTIGHQRYLFLRNRTHIPASMTVRVEDARNGQILFEGKAEDTDDPNATIQGDLEIKLPEYGSYYFQITRRRHVVTIRSREGAVFSYLHLFGDVRPESQTGGTIPPWQGPTDQAL